MSKASSSSPVEMGKIWVEICIVSARGLPRSSLWKQQWYAVGWVDPNNKYCTRIDNSGSANPVWRTKFTAVVDATELSFEDSMLHVEVYSREPIFLREKLHGTAAISLKEFLAKHGKSSDGLQVGNEDMGSFQLRRKSSNKPHGFVDISIRTSLGKEGTGSVIADHEGFQLSDNSQEITLATQAGPAQAYPAPRRLPQVPFSQPANRPPGNHAYTHPTPYPSNYSNPSVGGPSYPSANGPAYPPPRTPPPPPPYPNSSVGGPIYQQPRTPPPPPPPSHVGYVPTFIPRADVSSSYLNLPPSAGAGVRRPGGVGGAPAFAAGMGAGALAAGAVIFGDDFMSGFDLPSGLRDPSLTVSVDPPF